MDYLRQPRHPMQNAAGFAAVAMLHVALIYALVNGLATAITERATPPMTARILNRQPPPPAPPAPPALPAPNAPAPFVFVPKVEWKVAPPPAQPRAPIEASRTPPRTAQAGAEALPAPGDSKFSPSAIIGGVPAPAYPPAYEDAGRPGKVTVDCVIETNGNPDKCRILSAAGGGAFAAETLRWLTGQADPVYRPALKGGVPQREEHQWVVMFEAPVPDDTGAH